jgi:hypothetical protein
VKPSNLETEKSKLAKFYWMRFERPLACLFILGLTSFLQGKDLTMELDEYWVRVSQAVKTGDLEAYRATCHTDGVLVSGKAKKSELLSQALVRWGKEFADTRAGKMKAQVEFRFSERITGKDTAHETGIFLYSSKRKGEEWKKDYVHFEALLVKKNGKWKILMEFQKSSAIEKEWASLAKK